MTKDNYFEKIIFCSNVFINVRKLVIIDGREPFSVYKGMAPMVSLYAAIRPKKWILAVYQNKTRMKSITVDENIIESDVTINFLHLPILHASYNGDELLIDRINLTTLGFDLVGDQSGMRLGGLLVSNSSFENTEIGISIDSKSTNAAHQLVR
jgi:hypothetical protein